LKYEANELRKIARMSQQSLDRFGGYRLADELFDLVVAEVEPLNKIPACWRLVGQQIAAADSICANIEEGYGRESTKELVRYLVIARGSAREVRGRYHRLRHWLPPDLLKERQERWDSIIGILTRSIARLRHNLDPDTP
jgi:four helix bundle protein